MQVRVGLFSHYLDILLSVSLVLNGMENQERVEGGIPQKLED